MLSNTLFVKSKFEDRTEMENVESPSSPSKSSPMNLSTRPIERNVLKELNNLEGGTKSSKQVSATDDQEIQLKDSANLSSNLPDIVTNVYTEGNIVLNKNLLYAAGPSDVQSDDEYVDCNTTLKDNLSGIALNKTIEKVPSSLNETIHVKGEIVPTSNEPNENNYTKREESENITENQSMNDEIETVGSTGNGIDTTGEPLVCEQEDKYNCEVNLSSVADRPLAIEDIEQKKSIPDEPLALPVVIDSQVGVIESSAAFIDSAVVGPDSNLSQTPPLTEQLNSDFSGNLTKIEAELTSTINTFSDTDDNDINKTVLVEANPGNFGYETGTDTADPKELPQSTEVKQFREYKINQTVSVDSLEFDCEARDCSLDSLEMKEPIQHEQTTPTNKFLSASVGDEMFAKKKSPDLSELFSCSNQSTNEFANEKYPDLPDMIANTSQTSYKETKPRFSLSRQDAVYNSPTIVSNQGDVPVVNVKTELPNNETPNKSSATDSTKSLIRRDSFDASIPVSPNDIKRTRLEELPKDDISVNNESISNLPDQDTLFVASPLVCHQDNREINSELPIETSSNEYSTGNKIDFTNHLKRRCTFNMSSAVEEVPNTDMPATNELSESRSSLPRQGTFSISVPSCQIPGTNDKPTPEELIDANLPATNSLNDTSLNLLRQDTFSIPSSEVSHQIMSNRTFDDCIPMGSNDKLTLSEELQNVDLLTASPINNLPRQDTFTVSSLAVSHQSDSEIISELTAKSPNKCLERSCTYVSSPGAADDDRSTLLFKVLNNAESDQSDVQFKAPPLPISAARTVNKADSDNHFLVLSSNDFDFLQSRGTNCDPVDDRRNSLLLRFDPLSRRSVHKPILALTEETVEQVETTIKIENNLQETDPNILCGNSSGENSSDEQQSSITRPQATNASEMSVSLVHDSNNMDNETNSTEDKHIAVDGVPLSDKKIKFEYSDGNIQKKMEEYEATQEILVKRLTEKDKTLSKNCAIIEAYEKALAELVAEKEKLTDNYEVINEKLRHERDIHHQHLMSLENTFSDLHMKYERSKEFTVKLQERLDLLSEEKGKIDELLKQQEIRYEKMKQHALHQLEYANSTLEDQEKNNSRENSRLKALLKIEEVSRNTIQEQLLQKCKENDELVKICDELIGGQKS